MVGRAARRQARRKNICTGTAVIHCLLNPGQAQYCKLFFWFFFFFNNNRFCRNDLSYWKDKRGALFCSHEPLVWLSIAPNVIITGGINYLSVTSHNFQICFKTGSCSVPGNKYWETRKKSRARVTSPLLTGTCKKTLRLEHGDSLVEDPQVTLQLWVLRRWKFQSACSVTQLFLSTGLRKLQIK